MTASDRPDLADFQCNGALAAAKAAEAQSARDRRARSPRAWRTIRGWPRVEIAGPGFINLRVSRRGAGRARADAIAADPRAGRRARSAAPRRVLVDYGGPNVAKEMHVGHLRASIIGESIKRLFRFRGDEVLGDAHFGDWGFQMGLLIVAVLRRRPGDRRRWSRGSRPRAGDADAGALLGAALGPHRPGRPRPALSGRRGPGQGRRRLSRPRPPGHGRAAGRPLRLSRCSGATSPTSPARRWSATSTRWASISTSGRARATSMP